MHHAIYLHLVEVQKKVLCLYIPCLLKHWLGQVAGYSEVAPKCNPPLPPFKDTCNPDPWCRGVGGEIKGCLWLTRGLIILEMKAGNELAISLPVYFKSHKK